MKLSSMVHIFSRTWGLTLTALLAMGCSSLLDPAVCESDEDCMGGICSEGICIGEIVEPQVDAAAPEMDARPVVDGMTMPSPDSVVPDQGPVMQDMTIPEADMAPVRVQEPPECDLIIDGPLLTAEDSTDIIITASDSFDAFDALSVDLAVNQTTTEISLNVMGQFAGRIPLSLGPNTLRLTVTDTDGQTCEVERTLEVDSEGPLLALTQPANVQDILTNESSFIVRGTVEDAHFVDDLEVVVNDRIVNPMGGIQWVDGQFEFELTLEFGWQMIALVATDDLGNEGNRIEFNVELDNQAPSVVLMAPSPGSVTPSRRIEVVAEVRDGDAPLRNARYTLSVSGESDLLAYPEANADAFGELRQPIVLFDGQNQIEVCAEDDATNQTCVSTEVTKTAPCINLDSPSEGDYIGSLVVRISGHICPGVTEVSASIDGAEPRGENILGAGDFDADGRFTMDVNVFQAGGHRIELVARTPEDERAVTELNLEFDPSAPLLSLRQPNRDREDQQICVGPTTRIIGTARDDQSGLESVTINGIELDEATIGGGGAGGEFRYDIEFAEGERARQNIDIVARNRAGLRTEYSTWVTVDTIAPSINFDLMHPFMEINPFLRPNAQGEITLTGELNVGECGITGGGFTVGNTVTSINALGRFEFTQAFPDGQHSVAWSARDIAGNESGGNYAFQVDGTSPSITIDSPADGYFVSLEEGSEVRVTARVADSGSGLQQVLVNGVETQPFAVLDGLAIDHVVPGLVEGPNLITIRLSDGVGNVEEVSITVHRDTSAPTVNIALPLVGSPVALPVTVVGTATDVVQVDGGPEIQGRGLAQIFVNGVEAVYDPDTQEFFAGAVDVDPNDPNLIVTASDLLGNASEPIIRRVAVNPFGMRDPSVDGFGLADDVRWTDVIDLNGDGLLDIIALSGEDADAESDGSAVYLQNDSAGFNGRRSVQAGLPLDGAYDASIGDFDSDGALDLVMTTDANTYALNGDGTGGFFPSAAIVAGQGPGTQTVLGDLNRDGRLDLLLSRQLHFAYYRGDEQFDFSVEQTFVGALLETLENAIFLALGDMDMNGVIDLLAFDAQGAQLYMGERDNSFVSHDGGELGAGAIVPEIALWFDANRDGVLDLFVVNEGQHLVYLGTGQGTYVAQDMGLNLNADDRFVMAADMDGDTRDDLVVAGANGITVWRQTAVGFEVSPNPIPFDGAVTALTVDDIDLDGDFDILVGTDHGIQLIRSNLSQLNPDHQFRHVHVRRGLNPDAQPEPGPSQRQADGLGAELEIEYLDQAELDDPNILGRPVVSQRAMVARHGGPTLVTLGNRAGARVRVRFVDVGAPGRNTRTLNGLSADGPTDAYSPE